MDYVAGQDLIQEVVRDAALNSVARWFQFCSVKRVSLSISPWETARLSSDSILCCRREPGFGLTSSSMCPTDDR
jgi:hypothetical protein